MNEAVIEPVNKDSLLNSLSVQLKHELSLQESIYKIAEKKRDVIVSGNVIELTDTIKKEQMCMNQGAELTQKRNQLILACAKHLSIPNENIKLAKILEKAPEPLRAEIEKTRLSLKDVLIKLKDINDRNMSLIRQSLTFMQEVISLVSGADVPQGYGSDGSRSNVKKSGGGLFNRKI